MSAVADIMNEIAVVASLLYQKSWADSHSGNISVISGREDMVHLPEQYFLTDILTLPVTLPVIDGCFVALTASGTRMRDVAKSPENNIIWLQVADKGTSVRLYSYNGIKLKPTSEYLAHLQVFNSVFRGSLLSVVHTHIPEVTAITHIGRFCSDEALNKILWKMQPESVLLFPEGIGFIPYIMTGSPELAAATAFAAIKNKIIIWEKHGILSLSKRAENAFDFLETIAGSFRLYLTCLSAGFEPEGLTNVQIEELRKIAIFKEPGL